MSGKRALVTGGTRGIGRTTSLALARAGAQVVACYRGDHDAAATLRTCTGWDPRQHHTLQADLTTDAGRSAAIEECRSRLSGIDVLVNNLGSYETGSFASLSESVVQETVHVNLLTHYLVTKAALPLFSAGTSVVNVGAGMAMRGRTAHAHFTAAKAGLLGFTRSLAKELGPKNVRVNNVAPGVVQTERQLDLPDGTRSALLQAIPLRRFCQAEEVTGVIMFLASDLSSFITGSTINVDGGI
ncbi:SDR family NAD(P)-dependent oxidoreductase [Amycolatopsis echigonensis]|uniref:SDR family NAD(P)-dependent oxidoreductase n=1 Tax=Amycolatopsis echigonensis TaxID=2576905 RepID=UPI0013049EFB|nr:SDR family oxidoreductase [Amycolatopsis niigatensis]